MDVNIIPKCQDYNFAVIHFNFSVLQLSQEIY